MTEVGMWMVEVIRTFFHWLVNDAAWWLCLGFLATPILKRLERLLKHIFGGI